MFDTGVLLELAADSPPSRIVRDRVLTGTVRVLTGELNVMELRYILCRKVGAAQAARSINSLSRASQVRVLPASGFLEAAAEMKCKRNMSLVDCVTVTMGESLGLPVLFARREKEVGLEMKKSPFGAKLVFLESP